jgi:hypothetical protein
MVEANEARFCQFSHRILLCPPKTRWVPVRAISKTSFKKIISRRLSPRLIERSHRSRRRRRILNSENKMKKIGFLSFGHWTPSPQSQTRSASDALLQSIELAVAAEQLGADGA